MVAAGFEDKDIVFGAPSRPVGDPTAPHCGHTHMPRLVEEAWTQKKLVTSQEQGQQVHENWGSDPGGLRWLCGLRLQ